MNEYINNDNGTVSLDENVVAQVAGMTALDCFGITNCYEKFVQNRRNW